MKDLINNVTKGNPGAVCVIAKLGVEYIKIFNNLGILGPKIWVLYKNVCAEEIETTREVLEKIKNDENYTHSIENKKTHVMKYLFQESDKK